MIETSVAGHSALESSDCGGQIMRAAVTPIGGATDSAEPPASGYSRGHLESGFSRR